MRMGSAEKSNQMMNLSIAGTLGRDAETRQAAQSLVTNFSVAVSGYDHRDKQKITTWVRVAIWGKRGEQLASMLTKGTKVAVSGEMTLSDYNGKTSIGLKAQDVTLLGGKPKEAREDRSAADNRVDSSGLDDDDIPF